MKVLKNLSRRERQIMDIVYELNEATVAQVLELISDPPSYSTVRALLRVLARVTSIPPLFPEKRQVRTLSNMS